MSDREQSPEPGIIKRMLHSAPEKETAQFRVCLHTVFSDAHYVLDLPSPIERIFTLGGGFLVFLHHLLDEAFRPVRVLYRDRTNNLKPMIRNQRHHPLVLDLLKSFFIKSVGGAFERRGVILTHRRLLELP